METLPVTILVLEADRLYQPGRHRPVRALDFDVTCDMLELADDWSMTLGFTPDLWRLCRTDAEVEIHVGDSRVLTGYIGARNFKDGRGGATILLRGRDKGGRLVDDAAPLVTYEGLGILDLSRELVRPWFSDVVATNAKNRTLIRGRGARGAGTSGEPIDRGVVSKRGKLTKMRRKVRPGETRGEVLLDFLEEAFMLGWSSADGRTFYIGQPNQEQAPQWWFVMPASPARSREASVLDLDYTESVEERYAQIVACGAGKPSELSYGDAVRTKRGVAKNNPASTDGTGRDFLHPKTQIIADDELRDAAAAQDRAEHEMRVRDARGRALELVVPGAGQRLGAAGPIATFGFDTIAHVEHELVAEVEGDYLVTRCRFRRDKNSGQVTELSLVPRGTELAAR